MAWVWSWGQTSNNCLSESSCLFKHWPILGTSPQLFVHFIFYKTNYNLKRSHSNSRAQFFFLQLNLLIFKTRPVWNRFYDSDKRLVCLWKTSIWRFYEIISILILSSFLNNSCFQFWKHFPFGKILIWPSLF